MADQKTRNNHYVPQWYQRGFLAAGQSEYYLLDLSPEKPLPDGRTVPTKELYNRGPKKCFNEVDLYTTSFGAIISDEIERYLFGKIDDTGAKAVRAYIEGNASSMHKSFQDFFEYLDAQKLRTPKGLDWIKSRYSALNQVELMQEMQCLRLMHCTMWAEGVREIVSAEESEVKFIVTDHPVTVYNAALPPEFSECSYPGDPLIELVGSQTIFALDSNTCIILTHLEYVQNSTSSNLTKSRTNARYQGTGIVRTDTFIRKRKLSQDKVITINYLLKKRAKKYIASENKEWLYPEKLFTGEWKDIAEILLPKDDLWLFGGDMYLGYDDGSTYYQDAYGRTSDAHKYLKRSKYPNPSRNDPCGCGSGRKFKHCCQYLKVEERPTWRVYGIRERNLMFSYRVQEILGISNGKTWDDVRREISDEHVKEIHQALASLWPKDTDLAELHPRPTNRVFRTLYFGPIDARTIMETVLCWLKYFDEVVVVNPFLNPVCVKPKLNPIKSPTQHKEETLRNVLLLLHLEPFIDAGIVHLIPDPGDYNNEFSRSKIAMARKRTTNWTPSQKGSELFKSIIKDDYWCSLGRLSEHDIKQYIRKKLPKDNNINIDDIVSYLKTKQLNNPCALLQPIDKENGSGQLLFYKGFGLESALYLATLTGSVIIADLPEYWQQLHQHTSASSNVIENCLKSILNDWQEIIFPIDMDYDYVLHTRLIDGSHGEVRAPFRKIVEYFQNGNNKALLSHFTSKLTEAIQKIRGSEQTRQADNTQFEGRIEISIPTDGFERSEVRRLLLIFGRAKSIKPVPMAMFVQTSISDGVVTD
ncbi:MAG: DUF4238 domain-containing protein [Magnetococcales bacterium]|nr:DUF4238 domain-containing protein [Magnetococcales bacterium]